MRNLLDRILKKDRNTFSEYLDMRKKTIESRSSDYNRLDTLKSGSFYAMLCDYNFTSVEEGERFTSLACFADGTVNLFHSKGGGVFGAGQESEPVKNACIALLRNTEQTLKLFKRTEDFFLPELESARVYAVTDNGIYMIEYNIYLAWVHDENLLRIRILSDELISAIRRHNRGK